MIFKICSSNTAIFATLHVPYAKMANFKNHFEKGDTTKKQKKFEKVRKGTLQKKQKTFEKEKGDTAK